MKKIVITLIITTVLTSSCSVYKADFSTESCPNPERVKRSFTKAAELEKLLEEIAENGAPGVALAVSTNEGDWSMAKGYARIEDKTAMQTCHLQYLQSISKTYLAIAILKLYEQGKIGLDDPMTKYLPQQYHHYIAGADKITIRMLLNHTSGIAEYNFDPHYVSTLLQKPEQDFTPEDYLRYIRKKGSQFEPGSKHVYTNTNYEILALIGDALAGDHTKLISETIFKPLGLANTFYRSEPGYLQYKQLVNSYWDRYSNSILENVSALQRNNVENLVGDDGIVTTPGDAVKFLKGLVEGKLLADSTMQQMKTWVNDGNGNPIYGLGLVHREMGGFEAYGHSGGGIGAGCELYYFPEKNTCYFIAINLGTVTDSPMHAKLYENLSKFYKILLQ